MMFRCACGSGGVQLLANRRGGWQVQCLRGHEVIPMTGLVLTTPEIAPKPHAPVSPTMEGVERKVGQ